MGIRPMLSALMRNKTGPLLVALQIAVTLAIVLNAVFIVSQRIETAAGDVGRLLEAPELDGPFRQHEVDVRDPFSVRECLEVRQGLPPPGVGLRSVSGRAVGLGPVQQ